MPPLIIAADKPAPNLHQARLDRLARTLAMGAVTLHLMAGLLIVGWVFVVIPTAVNVAVGMQAVGDIRWFPQTVLIASNINENCSRFWYPILALTVAIAVVDYLVVVWVTNRLGFKWGVRFVIAVFLVIILNLYLTHLMLLVQPIQRAIDETSKSRPA